MDGRDIRKVHLIIPVNQQLHWMHLTKCLTTETQSHRDTLCNCLSQCFRGSNSMKTIYYLFFFLFSAQLINAQNKNLVYVDKQGVMRWTKDKTEATFFGVNYTVPFAYGYRS